MTPKIERLKTNDRQGPSLQAVKILVQQGKCPIPLTKGRVTYVDPEVWASTNRKNWRAKKSRGGWYAYKIETRHGKKTYIYLHRLIMNTPKGQICHHRFGHTLDNRKSQLENVTPTQHEQHHQMLRISQKIEGVPRGQTQYKPP